MGDELTELSEVLLRQIHPSFLQDGVPSSQPFSPTPKDDNKLSLDRSSQVEPVASFNNFIASGQSSVAVFGISVSEFNDETITCRADPIAGQNPAHAVADYSAHGTNQQKIKGKRLKIKALERGRLYP